MVSMSRLKEKLRAYRKVFGQNWDLFKASKIGIVGIIIVLFFVGMAVIAPFLNLRDPINWRAPDADIIDVTSWWGPGINTSANYWNGGEPINRTVSFRVKAAGGQATEADRVYFTSGNDLYAVRPSGGTAWLSNPGASQYFNFSHVTEAPFSTDVVVANFGFQYHSSQVDFILGVGTYDGYIYLIEDWAGSTDPGEMDPVPSGDMVYMEKLSDSAITSVALYSTPFSGRTPEERFFFGTQDGYLYAYSAAKLDNENWVYDNGEWTYLSPDEGETGPSPTRDSALVYDPINGQFIMFGGDDGTFSDETWVYYPDNTTWMRVPTAVQPLPRKDHKMVFDPVAEEVILFGGKVQDSPTTYYFGNDTWSFDVNTMTWSQVNTIGAPSGRYDFAMAFDTDTGVALLYGGFPANSETWTYDHSTLTWTNMNPLFYPSGADEGAAMVYDSVNQLAVLFGGIGSQGETWIYDPGANNWTDANPSSPPETRSWHSMVFDDSSGEVVLFGGLDQVVVEDPDDDIYYNETWTYDVAANVWTMESPGTIPSARIGHMMAYDSDRLNVYLFGGYDRGFSRLWYREVSEDAPVYMAGFPLNTPTDPNYSPALNAEGSTLFMNAGGLQAVRTIDGSDAWGIPPIALGANWTNPPVLADPQQIGLDYAEIVYAATNHGWIYGFYSNNGTALASWDERNLEDDYASRTDGIPIMKTSLEFDAGELTIPDFFGDQIYLGSSSGYMYSIRRDPLPGLPAGSTVWKYFDRTLFVNGFSYVGGVRFHRDSRLLFAFGVEGTATPKDTSDDVGTLFSLGEDGNLSWRKSFDGRIEGTPTVWKDEMGTHPTPSVWFGTSYGVAHAYSSTGENRAPLPPGCYPSGNCYVLGTDAQGRDIYSQLMWGSQIALTVGLLAAVGSIGIGTIIGLVAGYSGGRIDSVLMRFTDVILVLPGLPFLIILAAVLGPSIWNIIFVLTIIGWPGTARVIRSEVLSLKERPFIDSARVTGASNVRIMFKHLAPNVMPLAFLYMTLAVSGSILFEAALSFLGLGDVNTPSWGQMLQSVQTENVLAAWWWLVPPGLAITFISLAFYLIGRAFEQIVNPRLRKR